MPKKRRAKARRLPPRAPSAPIAEPSAPPAPHPMLEPGAIEAALAKNDGAPATILPAAPPELELPPEPASAASASSSIDPAAVRTLEELDARAGVGAPLEPELAGEAAPIAPASSSAPAIAGAAEAIPFDAWFALMHGAFGLAAELTKLKSLAFDKAAPTAAPAFQAIYDTAAETPALRFLIAPQGKWFGRAAAVAAFALPMAQGVRAELAARRGGAPRGAAPSSSSSAAPSSSAGGIPGVPSAAFYAGLKNAGAPAAPSPAAELGAHE